MNISEKLLTIQKRFDLSKEKNGNLEKLKNLIDGIDKGLKNENEQESKHEILKHLVNVMNKITMKLEKI